MFIDAAVVIFERMAEVALSLCGTDERSGPDMVTHGIGQGCKTVEDLDDDLTEPKSEPPQALREMPPADRYAEIR